MTTLTKKWASVLCWALLSLSYSASNAQTVNPLDPTQVYTTGNIVQPTVAGTGTTPWVNGVYQDNLTCWGWGDPGYCGPNAIVRPGGNINFSYGTTNLYQMQAISSILPNSGSGLRVNGYNFGFTAKNGNGWDDGRLDYLAAYVSFYDPNGSLAYNKNYDLNSRFNWTSFNYSENFNTPYATKDLGSVQYGFVGRDNNFWAGPYGPEIYNVNFSLKYSVDPCFVSVLNSPSCPGYLEEISKLSSSTLYSTPTESVISTSSAPPAATTSAVTADGTQPTIASNSMTIATGSTAVSTSSPSTNATPTANNPQPKVGEITTSSSPSTTNKSTVSTSQILSIVAGEQNRLTKLETSTAQAAVEQAKQEAAKAVAESQAIAANSVSQSISSSQLISGASSVNGAVNLLNPGVGSVVNISAVRPPEISNNQSFVSQTNQNIVTQISKPAELARINQGIQIESVNNDPMITLQRREEKINYSLTEDISRENGLQLTGVSPILNAINSPNNFSSTTQEKNSNTVKKNTPDNQAADGISIASIAQQPQGFDLYMAGIKDAPFYPPKEIYRNQKTVDNARAQRLLNGASDKLYQQMIEQQYQIER
jgi:hypothetical protein